jgi:hypothetical protein
MDFTIIIIGDIVPLSLSHLNVQSEEVCTLPTPYIFPPSSPNSQQECMDYVLKCRTTCMVP